MTNISTRAAWARRALRDAGIEVTQQEAEHEIARRYEDQTPLWCVRCGTIAARCVDQRTLVDVCIECGAPVGDP